MLWGINACLARGLAREGLNLGLSKLAFLHHVLSRGMLLSSSSYYLHVNWDPKEPKLASELVTGDKDHKVDFALT